MPDAAGPAAKAVSAGSPSASPPSDASTARWDGEVLVVRLVGRLQAPDIELMSMALADAPERFAVVLDRRSSGAPSAAGRAALTAWGSGELRRLTPRIAAWGDVFDTRRLASLTRAGAAEGHGPGYPQRSFDDPDVALAWARQCLSGKP